MPLSTHIQWCNLSNVEAELNAKFKGNSTYPSDNLVLFAEVTQYSYVPVDMTQDDDGNFHIQDKEYLIGRKLFIGTNRQFIHKQIKISDDTVKIDLESDFITGWNDKKYVIFRNGLLMNPATLHFVIPTFDNSYLKKMVYSTVTFCKGDIVDIYYIESGDDMSRVPVSRDTYISSFRYRAKKDNDRIIKIPYPNDTYPRSQSSFFVFHKNGTYLDNRIDYLISEGGQYITLSEEYALERENIDYIVFCFPMRPEEVEIIREDPEKIDFNTGTAFFKYAYSVRVDDEQTGAVKFAPKFDGYTLTSKNIMLFSSGTYIAPDRYDILDNETIIFKGNYDIANCCNKRYTMIIYDNDSNHSEYNVPGYHYMVEVTATEDDQHTFRILRPRFILRSILAFVGSVLLTPDKFTYDEDLGEFTLLEEGLEKGRSIYILFMDAPINDTKMERKLVPYAFRCNPKVKEGTLLPEKLHYQDLSKRYFLLFIGSILIPEECYTIRKNRIFLTRKFVSSLSGEFFATKWFVGIHVQTRWTTDSYEKTKEELDKSNQFEIDVAKDKIGGTMLTNVVCKVPDPKLENGVVHFETMFDEYMLHKPNFLLFGAGKWIDPSRFEIYDNDTLIFNNKEDRQYTQWRKYTMSILNDSGKDDRYNPSSYLIKRVVAEEDGQFYFEIPEVGARYRSFIVFRNTMFIGQNSRYRLRDDRKAIILLKPFDFMKKGEVLSFVFLDAFSREGQESILKQISFRCDPSGVTEVPKGMVRELYSNIDQLMLFRNGSFLDPSQYHLDGNKLYLDGYLGVDPAFEHYTFTAVYILNYYTKVKDYNFTLPVKPAFPVHPNYSLKNAYFSEHSSTKYINTKAARFDAGETHFEYYHSAKDPKNATGELVFDTPFTDYTFGKLNILLFSEGKIISPTRFMVSYGNRVIFTNAKDIAECGSKSYTMVLANDVFFNGGLSSRLVLEKETASFDGQRKVNIPARITARHGFMVFLGSEPLDTTEYNYDSTSGEITLLSHSMRRGQELTVVGLSAISDGSKRERTLNGYMFEMTNLGWMTGVDLGAILVDSSLNSRNMIAFVDGKFLNPADYEVKYGRFFMKTPYVVSPVSHSLFILYLDSEDKGEDVVLHPNYGTSGIIKLNNGYTKYNLCKGNFLLFADGLWVHPDEYEIYDNDTLFILGDPLRWATSSTKWSMLVFDDDADYTSLGYMPTYFKSEKVPVEEDNQTLFIFPKINRDFTTVLVFNSRREMLPIDDTSRFDLNYLEGTIRLLDPKDYLNKGDYLEFVFLNGHTTIYQRTILLHESMDITTDGQYIPYSFYNEDNFDEKYLALFIDGKYVSYDDYQIVDNKLYLDPVIYNSYPYRVSLVHIISLRNEDYDLDTIQEVRKPESQKDAYNIQRCYSILKPESERVDSGIVGFLPIFGGYDLTNENILLFGKGLWIHPSRFNMLTNGIIQFTHPDDMEASDDTFYTMIVLDNAESGSHKAVNVVVRQVTATTDLQTEFDIPNVLNSTSYLIFRGSMLLPTALEDRVKISEDGTKLTLVDENDALEKGRSLYFVFIVDNNLLDRRIPRFIQDTFRCSRKLGDGTAIPEEWYLLEVDRSTDLNIRSRTIQSTSVPYGILQTQRIIQEVIR